MIKKLLAVSFHCDGCGEDFHVVGTEVIKEQEKAYFCIHCGAKGNKLYTYNDFYVTKDKRMI